ncbi:hypothetical protein HDU98_009633 [Podochytrium sp. JEL0797]|nr:hypothetical protein HDU98_009633 [Podochytrium sp. JEL0797]
MGNCESIPIASQMQSLVQVCQGDHEGALQTQIGFSRQCVGVAQVRSIVEAACGDSDEALKTQLMFIAPQNAIEQSLFVVSSVAAPFVAGVTVAGIGFSEGGIVAGSVAAGMMRAANPVAAGSVVALLQSVGAKGLGVAASAGIGSAVGVGVGAGVAASESRLSRSVTDGLEHVGIVTWHGGLVTAHAFHFTHGTHGYLRWEQFRFIVVGEDQVAIMCWHDGFLSANPDGGVGIQRWILDWELFTVEKSCKEDWVAIKSKHGKYLCAEKGGWLICNREEAREWECLALRTVLNLNEALNSRNWEALSALCDESTFTAIVRPASLNLPAKNFSEYKAYLSGFDSSSQVIDADEIYELQKGDKTIVIHRSVNVGTIAGVSATGEIVSTFEVNQHGLIVSIKDFYDSQVLTDFFVKLGM